MKLHFIISKLFSFRLIVFLTLLILTGYRSSGQNFGYFASAVNLNVHGTQQYYNTFPGSITANSINPAPGAPFFSGSLGSFTANSGSLNLKGGEVKTYKNNGGNVCGAAVFYRVYKTGDPAPAFTSLTLPFFSNCAGTSFPDAGGGPCSGNDQKWGTFSESVDLTQRCPGNYTFELYYTVTGSNSGGGCGETMYDSNSGSNYIANFTITSDMQVTASSDAPVCEGSAVQLGSTITGGNPAYTYAWSGPSGFSSALAAPVISGTTAAEAGSYTVTVTDGCNASVSAATNVTVNPLPSNPEGTITNPTCTEPTGAVAITSPASGVAYSFDNGSTYVSGSFNDGLLPGTYQVKVRDDVTGCESAASSFIINQAPAVPVASASSNSPQCSGNAIQLTAADAGAGAVYSWTGPNGFSSTDQNPVIPYSVSALGTYTLIVTSLEGCSAMSSTDVVCGALPVRLVSFKAEEAEQVIELQWEAVDASGFSYFEVERSSNAKSFKALERVYYMDQKQLYAVKDTLPLTGKNYYRLNMVDADGSNGYSKVIEVTYSEASAVFAHLENPSGSSQIHLFTNIAPVTAALISTTGKEIRLKLTRLNEREWLIESKNIPENQLSMIRITGPSHTLVRKFIKAR